jgi:hypothetical protein
MPPKKTSLGLGAAL